MARPVHRLAGAGTGSSRARVGVAVGRDELLVQASVADDAAQVWASATGGNIDDLTIPVRLFVDPDYRALGAGRDLMLAAGAFAMAERRQVAFDVMLKDTRAIKLYGALGCKRLGTITHHHSEGRTEPAAVYGGPDNPPTQ